ncbi:hypothetical protein CAEBREN_28600 [Caenorhabditis brenneri]|uniref:Uncharacterized protein n=1 Tax=Caenorhabditis brenneri TaxID=135651 RepID=G0N8N4_CAEBE|nr:hypothetical protein CAEBREN_28600 [Caenorhabditis brenneri]
MVFWEMILVGNYLLASVGFIANIFYWKLVVFNSSFDGYSRIASFIIASATTLLIVSNVISTSVCLSYGSYFNSGPCLENGLYILMVVLHSYGECSIVAGLFILAFEKSVFAILFSTVSASILYLTSFLLVIYLFCAAKRRYYETLGIIPLTQRYMISESYELCRSTLPATISSLAINIVLFISFWMLLFDIIPQTKGNEYFVLANMVCFLGNNLFETNDLQTLNVTATLFPILFIIGSRKIRRKFVKINPFNHQQVESKEDQNFEVRQLNGNRINFTQTQNEYFEQLQSSWS